MEIQVTTYDWLQLPMEVRVKLREKFNIPRSEGTVVEDGKVKSDGTTYKDLSAITVEKMHKFLYEIPSDGDTSLHETQDFVTLFHAVVKAIEAELAEVPPTVPEIDSKQLLVDEWVAVLSRIKGQATEKGMTDYLDNVLKRVFDIKPTLIQTPNVEKTEKRGPGRPKKTK